jgi:prepilin-type N-terminal cleavage/methylation domain-containing protein
MMAMRHQSGFALIEVLIAMVVLAIAIITMVAVMSSGATALNHSNQTTRAGTLADNEMEIYRSMPWSKIALTTSRSALPEPTTSPDTSGWICPAVTGSSPPVSSCPTTVTTTTAVTAASCPTTATTVVTSPLYDTLCPSRTIQTGDGRRYRVDNHIRWFCPTGTYSAASGCMGIVPAQRPEKLVAIIVRDGDNPSKILFRESSTFDQATGY